MSHLLRFCLFAVLSSYVIHVQSQQLSSICVETIAAQSVPTALAATPGDNRFIFVASRAGQVYRYNTKGDASGILALSVADDSATFVTGGERGLLDITFHPNFQSNGLFYTFQSVPPLANSTVYERQMDPQTYEVNPTHLRLVLSVEEDFFNHNGGAIVFGPADGKLFVSLGDGGGANDPNRRAQDTLSLLGKVLRIDVDEKIDQGVYGEYGIPADNPFVGNANYRAEIYAIGLRNPWKCSFDSKRTDNTTNGPFYCGDVGQSNYEYVRKVLEGENHGWPKMDGAACRDLDAGLAILPETDCGAEYVRPMFYYTRQSGGTSAGLSVMGGFVYRGTSEPRLYGKYLFIDYGEDRLCPVWNDAQNQYNGVRGCVNVPSGAATIYALGPNASTDEFDNVKYLIPREEQDLENFILNYCANDTICPNRSSAFYPDKHYGWGEDNEGEVYLLGDNGVSKIISFESCAYSDFPTESPTVAPLNVALVASLSAVAAVIVGALALARYRSWSKEQKSQELKT